MDRPLLGLAAAEKRAQGEARFDAEIGIDHGGPRRSDGPAIVAGATDPEVVRYTVVPSPYGDEDLDKILQIADEGWSAGTDAVFAVCDAARPDELLGLLGLHGVELGLEPGGRAEIGYWMRPEGRGRGLMSRAAVLATSWAVHELDLAMLSWAGRGFVVANGHHSLLRGGFVVVPGNDEDGVGRTVLDLLG